MNGEVIKSFLVGLGFSVDDTSLSKFNKAIQGASTRVLALYGSVKVAAAGIFYGISKISESFEQLGYEYRIIAPMINKTLIMRRELLKAYGAAGINITKVVQESVKFNMSLTKTKFALEAIYKSVGAKFFPMLTKQMDLFRSRIYANMPKIQATLERFIKFIFKAFEATVILGTRLFSILGRVWDFFAKLDTATDGWSTKILALAAAWRFLNLAFLTTPLGMILTGLVALLALYDDFMTFKEGGESLFDWSGAVPAIETITDVIKGLYNALDNVVESIFLVANAFMSLFSGDLTGFIDHLISSIDMLGQAIKNVLGNEIINKLQSMGNAVSGFFGGANAALPFGQGAPAQPPIGASPQAMAGTNQNVNQQTSIVVQGSPDAESTGKAVAGQQNRVNFDMVRNMKGATR